MSGEIPQHDYQESARRIPPRVWEGAQPRDLQDEGRGGAAGAPSHLVQESGKPTPLGRPWLIVDTKETETCLAEAADERRHLARLDANGEGRSYDIEVHTAGGQVFCLERKATADAVSSWIDGKLADQVAAAGGLILEWNPVLVACMPKERREAAKNARRHIQRMSLSCPVVVTDSPEETVEFLNYLKRQERPVEVFASRMRVDVEDPRMALLAALPGLNPNRRLEDGRLLGEVIWEGVDAAALVKALGMETWAGLPRLGPKSVQKMANAICAGL